MSTLYPTNINGQLFKPDEQTNANPRWVAALSSAHRQDVSYCLCTPPSQIKLSVKLYGRDTPSSHYALARWPDTGLAHDLDCQYFTEDKSGPGTDENLSAFDELADGKIRVHLAAGLKIVESTSSLIDKPRTGQAVRKSRARASEVALLQRLWRTAGLNVYRGLPRTWFHATYMLIKTLERIVVSPAGETLADYMLIGSGPSDRLANEHNATVLARAKEKSTRLFVVGRMRQFKREKSKVLLPFMDSHGLPKVLVRVDQLDKFVGDRPFYRNLLDGGKSGHVIMIAHIEPDGRDWWKTVSVTGIATSSNMIPAESSFEIEFEQYLVGLSRKFIKPIVMNEVDDSDNRPDFILLDTVPRVRCEVWGMQTDAYLDDKIKRIADYARRGQTLVSWSANPREAFPALPAPVVTRDRS